MSAKISTKPFEDQLKTLQKQREVIEKTIADFIEKHAIARSVDFVLQDPLRICTEDNILLVSENMNVEWSREGVFFADSFLSAGNSIRLPAMTINKKCSSFRDAIGKKINELFVKNVLTNSSNLLSLDAKHFLKSYDGSVFTEVKFDPPEDLEYIRWPRGRATSRWIDFFDTEKDRESFHKILQELDANNKLKRELSSALESVKNFQTQILPENVVT
jgi:hypothetical protein